MRYLPGNAQHIGARQSQQDSFGFADPDDAAFLAHGGFLAVVCDGMGGMEHGDAASRIAVRSFLDAYRLKTPQESIPAALERSAREANHYVLEFARAQGLVEGVGTTLVAVALQENALYFISIGDSGIFHVSGGEIHTVNRPHIYANVLDHAVAQGRLSAEAAQLHPERESLTSFIGTETLEEIDRNETPWPMRDGDTILLASDGMFKTLSSDEMRASLHGHAQNWPENLVMQVLAKRREYQDNVTVLSVTITAEELAAVPPTARMDPHPPLAAVPAAPLPPSPAPPASLPSAKSKPLRWIVVLVLALTAVAASWWLVRQQSVAGQGKPPAATPPPRDPNRPLPEPDPIVIRSQPPENK